MEEQPRSSTDPSKRKKRKKRQPEHHNGEIFTVADAIETGETPDVGTLRVIDDESLTSAAPAAPTTIGTRVDGEWFYVAGGNNCSGVNKFVGCLDAFADREWRVTPGRENNEAASDALIDDASIWRYLEHSVNTGIQNELARVFDKHSVPLPLYVPENIETVPPSHVARYLVEASAVVGMRSCVRGQMCAARKMLMHPSRSDGVVLREFLTPIQELRYYSSGQLPEVWSPCIACLRFDASYQFFLAAQHRLERCIQPHSNPVDVPDGYRRDAVLQPEQTADGSATRGLVLPIRHFVTSEYLGTTVGVLIDTAIVPPDLSPHTLIETARQHQQPTPQLARNGRSALAFAESGTTLFFAQTRGSDRAAERAGCEARLDYVMRHVGLSGVSCKDGTLCRGGAGCCIRVVAGASDEHVAGLLSEATGPESIYGWIEKPLSAAVQLVARDRLVYADRENDDERAARKECFQRQASVATALAGEHIACPGVGGNSPSVMPRFALVRRTDGRTASATVALGEVRLATLRLRTQKRRRRPRMLTVGGTRRILAQAISKHWHVRHEWRQLYEIACERSSLVASSRALAVLPYRNFRKFCTDVRTALLPLRRPPSTPLRHLLRDLRTAIGRMALWNTVRFPAKPWAHAVAIACAFCLEVNDDVTVAIATELARIRASKNGRAARQQQQQREDDDGASSSDSDPDPDRRQKSCSELGGAMQRAIIAIEAEIAHHLDDDTAMHQTAAPDATIMTADKHLSERLAMQVLQPEDQRATASMIIDYELKHARSSNSKTRGPRVLVRLVKAAAMFSASLAYLRNRITGPRANQADDVSLCGWRAPEDIGDTANAEIDAYDALNGAARQRLEHQHINRSKRLATVATVAAADDSSKKHPLSDGESSDNDVRPVDQSSGSEADGYFPPLTRCSHTSSEAIDAEIDAIEGSEIFVRIAGLPSLGRLDPEIRLRDATIPRVRHVADVSKMAANMRPRGRRQTATDQVRGAIAARRAQGISGKRDTLSMQMHGHEQFVQIDPISAEFDPPHTDRIAGMFRDARAALVSFPDSESRLCCNTNLLSLLSADLRSDLFANVKANDIVGPGFWRALAAVRHAVPSKDAQQICKKCAPRLLKIHNLDCMHCNGSYRVLLCLLLRVDIAENIRKRYNVDYNATIFMLSHAKLAETMIASGAFCDCSLLIPAVKGAPCVLERVYPSDSAAHCDDDAQAISSALAYVGFFEPTENTVVRSLAHTLLKHMPRVCERRRSIDTTNEATMAQPSFVVWLCSALERTLVGGYPHSRATVSFSGALRARQFVREARSEMLAVAYEDKLGRAIAYVHSRWSANLRSIAASGWPEDVVVPELAGTWPFAVAADYAARARSEASGAAAIERARQLCWTCVIVCSASSAAAVCDDVPKRRRMTIETLLGGRRPWNSDVETMYETVALIAWAASRDAQGVRRVVDDFVSASSGEQSRKLVDTLWASVTDCETLYTVAKAIERASEMAPVVTAHVEAFALRHGCLCRVAVREAMVSAMSRVPAILRAFCSGAPWFPEFCEHAITVADALRIGQMRAPSSRPYTVDTWVSDISSSVAATVWHGNIYRVRRDSFGEQMWHLAQRLVDNLASKNVSIGPLFRPSTGHVALIREFISAMSASSHSFEGRRDIARALLSLGAVRASGIPTIDDIAKNDEIRDNSVLWAFGLREPALQILDNMRKAYANPQGSGRCAMESLASSFALDELLLVAEYYHALADAEALRVVPIGCSTTTERALTAMAQQYDARDWADVTHTVASFVACDACASILSQLTRRSAIFPQDTVSQIVNTATSHGSNVPLIGRYGVAKRLTDGEFVCSEKRLASTTATTNIDDMQTIIANSKILTQRRSCADSYLRVVNLLGALVEFSNKRFSTHGEEIGVTRRPCNLCASCGTITRTTVLDIAPDATAFQCLTCACDEGIGPALPASCGLCGTTLGPVALSMCAAERTSVLGVIQRLRRIGAGAGAAVANDDAWSSSSDEEDDKGDTHFVENNAWNGAEKLAGQPLPTFDLAIAVARRALVETFKASCRQSFATRFGPIGGPRYIWAFDDMVTMSPICVRACDGCARYVARIFTRKSDTSKNIQMPLLSVVRRACGDVLANAVGTSVDPVPINGDPIAVAKSISALHATHAFAPRSRQLAIPPYDANHL